jgi:glycosyltransferase involved in cell wall biosynthesis
MGRVRVLQVVDSLWLGGAEQAAVLIASHLDRTRFEPSLLVTRGGGPLVGQVEAAGVPLHIVPRKGRYDLRGLVATLRFLRAGRFDVIHSHKVGSNALLRLMAPLLPRGTQIITHEHIPLPVGTPAARLNAWLAPLADRIVCCSSDTHQSILATMPGQQARLVTIPNGIDVQRFTPRPGQREASRNALGLGPDALVAICVGRLRPQKGHEVLLQAWAQAGRSGSEAGQAPGWQDAQLLIVGDGEREGELRELAAGLGIGGQVQFLGARTDIPDLLVAADIAVSASHYEGLPLALLEAMAAGLPVVSTDVGSIRDVLHDGVGGWLVPPGKPETLAARVVALAQDPARRASWGAMNRARVQAEFSVSRMVARCEQLYEELLNHPAVMMRQEGSRSLEGGSWKG